MSNGRERLIQPTEVDPYERRAYPPSDDNLESLIDNWERYRDNLIIFLGAGASIGARNNLGAKLPAAYQLRNEIWRAFMLEPTQRSEYDYANLGLMSLEHAAALAEARADRNSLLDVVTDVFRADKPLWQHAVLPFLAPRAVFTTNYDQLIELGWRLHPSRLGTGGIFPIYRNGERLTPGFIPLYKPHGSIELARNEVGHGGLVITQFDYFEILNYRAEMLNEFMSEFSEHCVIFIGYGFQDMDIAAHLHKLRKMRVGPRWYAVFPRNDRDVRNMYSENYGIRQINRTFFDFMVDLDGRLNHLPEQWKHTEIDKLIADGFILERDRIDEGRTP